MNHIDLLKKFILIAGQESGQCQVEYACKYFESGEYDKNLALTDEEKVELSRLLDQAVKEYLHD